MTRFKSLTLVLCLVMMAALHPLASGGAEEDTQAVAVNPFMSLELSDLFGEPFDASVFDGKPFMINVWATWCGPCIMELPALEALHQQYGDKISIMGLLADGSRLKEDGSVELVDGEIDGAKEVYRAKALTYPTLIPDLFFHAAIYHLGLQAYPTTWFFNGKGEMLGQVVGARDEAQWAQLIDSVLEDVGQTDEDSVL